MPNYKVLVEFELDGVKFEADVIVDDIPEEVAATLVAEGKLVLVDEQAGAEGEAAAAAGGGVEGSTGNEGSEQHA